MLVSFTVRETYLKWFTYPKRSRDAVFPLHREPPVACPMKCVAQRWYGLLFGFLFYSYCMAMAWRNVSVTGTGLKLTVGLSEREEACMDQ